MNLSEWKTYEDWRRCGRQVKAGERSLRRDVDHKPLFHLNQTKDVFEEKATGGVTARQVLDAIFGGRKRTATVHALEQAISNFENPQKETTQKELVKTPEFADPSAKRDWQAMADKSANPTPKATTRPLCPVLLAVQRVAPLPNAWGRVM